MNLFFKKGEVDKEGNVIGGDLKEKCDEFVSRLDEFKNQYLSIDYNSNTESGKDQARRRKEFKQNLSEKITEYRPLAKENARYLSDLKANKEPLKKYLKAAHEQALDYDTIGKFMEMFSAEQAKAVQKWEEKCDRIKELNRQIEEANERAKKQHDKRMQWYHLEMINYNLRVLRYDNARRAGQFAVRPIPPIMPFRPLERPTYATPPKPLGKFRLPNMSRETMEDILTIVENRSTGAAPTENLYRKDVCVSHIEPFLERAVGFCDQQIQYYSDPKNTIAWFKRNLVGRDDISPLMFWMCSFDKDGIPKLSNYKLGDIYWSCLFMDLPSGFREVMKRFKYDKSGSSATKRWVENAAKKINTKTKITDDYSSACKRAIEVLMCAFKKTNPVTLSRRATIVQKIVKEHIKELISYLEKAKCVCPIIKCEE